MQYQFSKFIVAKLISFELLTYEKNIRYYDIIYVLHKRKEIISTRQTIDYRNIKDQFRSFRFKKIIEIAIAAEANRQPLVTAKSTEETINLLVWR